MIAAILKLLNIPDADAYRASSFTFKELENRRDALLRAEHIKSERSLTEKQKNDL